MVSVRERLGQELFLRVAGPDGAEHAERIHGRPGPRWFEPDSPIARVHGDASMFIGGIRALLLQTLHPAAMRGVAEHSGYRGDMWGRLARTSRFLAVTTFGTADDAERSSTRSARSTSGSSARCADGTPYAASDPHLLAWVHIAEIDSFLRAHTVYGTGAAGRGRARHVRRRRPPRSPAGSASSTRRPPRPSWRAALAAYRPELRSTPEAREAVSLPAAPPAAAAARPGAVRRVGGGRGRPDAALDAAAAAAARGCRSPSAPWSGRSAGSRPAPSGGR